MSGILFRFFILQEGVHYKQEQCVSLFFSDREITCPPFFMFTIVKYVRISLLVWTLFHKIIKCI
jgi:hypothetical protein